MDFRVITCPDALAVRDAGQLNLAVLRGGGQHMPLAPEELDVPHRVRETELSGRRIVGRVTKVHSPFVIRDGKQPSRSRPGERREVALGLPAIAPAQGETGDFL